VQLCGQWNTSFAGSIWMSVNGFTSSAAVSGRNFL
jgi:hypothetical protein